MATWLTLCVCQTPDVEGNVRRHPMVRGRSSACEAFSATWTQWRVCSVQSSQLELSPVSVKASQVKSSQVAKCQVKSRQVKSRQFHSQGESSPAKSTVKASQGKSRQVKASQGKSRQVKSSLLRGYAWEGQICGLVHLDSIQSLLRLQKSSPPYKAHRALDRRVLPVARRAPGA